MESKFRMASDRYRKTWRVTVKASMLYAAAVSPLMVGACGEPLPGDEISVTKSALAGRLSDDLQRKSIILTALPIVEDVKRTSEPCLRVPGTASKKWTMGYLLTQASSSSPTSTTASNFVKRWMTTWTTQQTINGETILPHTNPGATPPDSTAQILNKAWLKNSGGTTYAMDYAPFRLLAIVPRFDLRKRRRNGEGLGGELRFVFGPVDNNKDHACSTLQENTVILEYAVDRATENDVIAWAQGWMNLSALDMDLEPQPFKDYESYRIALEALTEKIVLHGKGSPYGRPNGSELIRIRTNEFVDPVWHMREWVIVSDPTKNPNPAPVKQTPRFGYKTSGSQVGNWVKSNATAVLNDTYIVPNVFPSTSTPMLGGQDVMDLSSNAIWKTGFPYTTPTDHEVRHRFAKNTCEGCHRTETGGTAFLHIGTRDPGGDSPLSTFLTGVTDQGDPFFAADPADGTPREFHEAADRAGDLGALVSGERVLLPEGIPNTNLATYFKLVNNTSSKCLDMGGSSTGVLAQQWTCGGAGNQRFAAISLGTGFYNIRVKQGNYCLEASSTSTAVTQQVCSSSSRQQATITSIYEELPYYEVRFANNRCLELPDSNNGTKARHSSCALGTGPQTFYLVE